MNPLDNKNGISVSHACFAMLVSVGALKRAYFVAPSIVFDTLERAGLVQTEEPNDPPSMHSRAVTITVKGTRVLRRFAPEALAHALEHIAVPDACWYIGKISSVAALAEFLAYEDHLIRNAAGIRLDELTGYAYDRQKCPPGEDPDAVSTFTPPHLAIYGGRKPIRTATILHPDRGLRNTMRARKEKIHDLRGKAKRDYQRVPRVPSNF